jgi:hypothetical protein
VNEHGQSSRIRELGDAGHRPLGVVQLVIRKTQLRYGAGRQPSFFPCRVLSPRRASGPTSPRSLNAVGSAEADSFAISPHRCLASSAILATEYRRPGARWWTLRQGALQTAS